MALRLGFRATLPKRSPPKQEARLRLWATQAAVESVRTVCSPFVCPAVSLVPRNHPYQTARYGRECRAGSARGPLPLGRLAAVVSLVYVQGADRAVCLVE